MWNVRPSGQARGRRPGGDLDVWPRPALEPPLTVVPPSSSPKEAAMARKAGPKTTAANPEGSAEQQFLRLMSHEMRTPLNGVIGMLGLLSRTRLDGAQRAYAEAAR